MHNINKNNFKKIEKNLKDLKKKYNFINPNDINKRLISENNILLTFDDGFKNNYFFAKKILKRIGIKAIFFVLTDFVSSKSHEEKIKVLKNIFPMKKNLNLLNYQNMTWSNLKELKKMGHTIGLHGKSHKKLSSINNLNDLKKEIIYPKRVYKKKLLSNCNLFAFPFGTYESVNKKSIKLIKSNYKYVFSGIRGDNKITQEKQLLFRDNIEDYYDFKIIDFFMCGYGDFLYKKVKDKILMIFSRN